MKLSTICILAGLACILVLAAGCTSTPSTPAVTTTVPTTAATAVPTTTAPVLTWTGTWNTTWTEDGAETSEIVHFTQTGSSVTGKYEIGNSTISGDATGTRLVGVWTDVGGEETYNGTFVFVMSADKNSFAGKWTYTGEDLENSTYLWNGVRV
jgi:hypothetical protein